MVLLFDHSQQAKPGQKASQQSRDVERTGYRFSGVRALSVPRLGPNNGGRPRKLESRCCVGYYLH
jgi:hypothetical protein